MGHIELAVPVSHIWYFKSLPSRIGHLIDLSVRELEKILYYESFIVIDAGNTSYKTGDIISEEEFLELEEAGKEFEADMGAPAIKKLLEKLDLEHMAAELRWQERSPLRPIPLPWVVPSV